MGKIHKISRVTGESDYQRVITDPSFKILGFTLDDLFVIREWLAASELEERQIKEVFNRDLYFGGS